MTAIIKSLVIQEAGNHDLRRSRSGNGPDWFSGPIESVVPVFMTLYIKHQFILVMDDEDVDGHLLSSNDWLNSLGIAEHAKLGRFCLTLHGHVHLWYQSIAP